MLQTKSKISSCVVVSLPIVGAVRLQSPLQSSKPDFCKFINDNFRFRQTDVLEKYGNGIIQNYGLNQDVITAEMTPFGLRGGCSLNFSYTVSKQKLNEFGSQMKQCPFYENYDKSFLTLNFDFHSSGGLHAYLEDFNNDAGLTGAELRELIGASASDIMKFALNIAFDEAKAPELKLKDDSAPSCRHKDQTLGKMKMPQGRLLRAVMGKQDVSYYQRFGFLPIRDRDAFQWEDLDIQFVQDFVQWASSLQDAKEDKTLENWIDIRNKHCPVDNNLKYCIQKFEKEIGKAELFQGSEQCDAEISFAESLYKAWEHYEVNFKHLKNETKFESKMIESSLILSQKDRRLK